MKLLKFGDKVMVRGLILDINNDYNNKHATILGDFYNGLYPLELENGKIISIPPKNLIYVKPEKDIKDLDEEIKKDKEFREFQRRMVDDYGMEMSYLQKPDPSKPGIFEGGDYEIKKSSKKKDKKSRSRGTSKKKKNSKKTVGDDAI